MIIALWRYRPQTAASNAATLRNLQETLDLMSRRQQQQEEELKELRKIRGDQRYEITLQFTHTAAGELIVDKATVTKVEASL